MEPNRTAQARVQYRHCRVDILVIPPEADLVTLLSCFELVPWDDEQDRPNVLCHTWLSCHGVRTVTVQKRVVLKGAQNFQAADFVVAAHDADYRTSLQDFTTFLEKLSEKVVEADGTVPELPVKDIVRQTSSSSS